MPPETSLQTFKEAVKLYQAGELVQAEELCHKIHAAEPQRPDPLNLLAIIKTQTRSPEQAHTYFNKAIELAPQRPDIRINYARFLLAQSAYPQAMTQCRAALELNNDQADAHNILANAYLALNQPDKALTSFQQVLRLDPNHVEAHIHLGQIYTRLEQLEPARQYLRTALRLNPRAQTAQAGLCNIDPIWLVPLEGKSLSLRPHREDDAPYLQRCFNDHAFMERYNIFIPRNQSLDALRQQIRENARRHPYFTQRIDWIIERKRDQRPIGLAALADIQFKHRRAEFLVGIPDKQQRHGGASLEASLLVFDFAFNKVQLNKLTSAVYASNPSAQHNTLALGFTQESYLRDHIYLPNSEGGGEYLDMYGNGMLEEDYRSNKRLARLARRMVG